jgi:hypothetical protein
LCFVNCYKCRDADKSLARLGRKQATATKDFDVHISIYNRNWRNISTVYIYITSPASNKVHREVGQAKELSALWYYEMALGNHLA